ncbi:hypothetical protein EXE43_10440 [Halorubrum sp. SS5]|nr:hypothetical protein EXE43_10440 [Halorubrum sp. SS5]
MTSTQRELNDTEAIIRRGFPAVGVVCSGLVFTFAVSQGWWPFVGPIGGVLVGSLLGFGWTISTKRISEQKTVEHINTKFMFALVNVYVSLLFLSSHTAFRTRPIIIYVAIGIIGILFTRQIQYGSRFGIVLVQIIIVAVATYYSSQIVFPAGAYNVDTERLIPMIQRVIATGGVDTSMFYSVTPVHQILVAILSLVTDVGVKESYIFGSLMAMGTSILVISTIVYIFQSLSQKEVLFAVLLYAMASFTLRRGLFPFKGNFFRPLILIIAIYALDISNSRYKRYLLIVIISFLALVTGHQYSSGMATIIVMSIAIYSVLRWVIPVDGRRINVRRHMIIPAILIVLLLSYSIYATESPALIKRIGGLLASIAEIGRSSGSTGGRYTQLDPYVLAVSTIGQFILYAIGTLGIIISVQRSSLQLDRIVTWIGTVCLMLALSAFVNAFVIPTPRIHGLLALFGLNIVGGVGLAALADQYGNIGISSIYIIIAVFLVFSLASPVAGASLSVVDDEVPQYRKYQTSQEQTFIQWSNAHIVGSYASMEVPTTDVPVTIVDNGTPAQGITNTTKIPQGTLYQYNEIAAERGIRTSNQPILGGRSYAFVTVSNATITDSQIYINGEQRVYLKN